MQAFFGFGTAVDVDVRLDNEEQRRWVEVTASSGTIAKLPLYVDGESVTGKISLRVRDGKRLDHHGVRVFFVGLIEILPERTKTEFIALSHDVLPPGELRGLHTLPFEFKNVEKAHESYTGSSVKLRYTIRAVIFKRSGDQVHERELWVHARPAVRVVDHPIKTEIGVTDFLHLEFSYKKSRFSLTDSVIGKIKFLLVRVKILYVELSVIRVEQIPTAPDPTANDSKVLVAFEVLEGAPIKGDVVPIRMFLSAYNLTPTYIDVNKRFSVRYFLNLLLVDEERRRYFKQQEIELYRDPNDTDGPPADVAAVSADKAAPTASSSSSSEAAAAILSSTSDSAAGVTDTKDGKADRQAPMLPEKLSITAIGDVSEEKKMSSKLVNDCASEVHALDAVQLA